VQRPFQPRLVQLHAQQRRIGLRKIAGHRVAEAVDGLLHPRRTWDRHAFDHVDFDACHPPQPPDQLGQPIDTQHLEHGPRPPFARQLQPQRREQFRILFVGHGFDGRQPVRERIERRPRFPLRRARPGRALRVAPIRRDLSCGCHEMLLT